MPRPKFAFFVIFLAIALCAGSSIAVAQESPYFTTYDHHLEEPGNLELEFSSTSAPVGGTRADSAFVAPYLELEYGVTGWWTTELYLEGQGRVGDSAVFTGWRIENRFRPLKREHWINPVLYFEYENINEATRILKETPGGPPDFGAPNAESSRARAHEIEAKLILSSQVHNWNIAENFLAEKNLSRSEGFEFGYSVGASRPLSTLASGSDCRFCAENMSAGVEAYGSLGSTVLGFTGRGNSQYIAPVVQWQVSSNSRVKFSPGFGLNDHSYPFLLRFSYTYEIRGFGRKLAALWGGR